MTGVKELQEIECLTAANFTEDDSVWTMAEGCFQEVTDAHSRQTVLWLPSFKTNKVVLVHLNFGGVFDEENSFTATISDFSPMVRPRTSSTKPAFSTNT